jgi:hypothetical protein
MGFSANTGDSGFISAFGAEGTVQPATKYVRLARLLDLRRPDQSPQPTTAGTLRLILDCTTRTYSRRLSLPAISRPGRQCLRNLVVSLCPSVNRASPDVRNP